MIDWNHLQPYHKTKQKSFEQLCYQIATRLWAGKGSFTAIDDSGGGDGVEFYLTLSEGSQWGWQAKYYEGSVRLSQGNRKRQIIKSLKKAVTVHPELRTWYLCLPMDLTPSEKKWFDEMLPKHLPKNRTIIFELWDQSRLHAMLNRPECNGIKQAFFNQLELSTGWFRQKFDSLFAVVQNKFDELLYVPNEEFEHWYLHPFLCDDRFRNERIAYYPRKLQELQQSTVEKTEALWPNHALWEPVFDKCKHHYLAFQAQLECMLPAIQARFHNLTPNRIFQLKDEELELGIETLKKITADAEAERRNAYVQYMEKASEKVKQEHYQQLRKLTDVESIHNEILQELRYYLSHSAMPLTWRAAHYRGNGGDGKTNFCVALTKSYLNKEQPAIFIPAVKLTGQNPLSDQLLTLLDIKAGYTFSDFLDALDTLGKVHDVRVPIILDGLNEALNLNGFWNHRIADDLPSLEREILQRKNLALFTTCRKSYLSKIWPDVQPDDHKFPTIYGFTNLQDKKKLIRNYFRHYRIQADLSFLSLERFTKPLYLKIYCEAVNPDRREVRQVTLGFDSIYTIFERYLKLCDQQIFKKIEKGGKLPPVASNKNVASRVLHQLAKQLWEHPARALRLEDIMQLADGGTPADFTHSVTRQLLDEELLFIRNWKDDHEQVYLTYDLMAGYFIAKYLLESVDDVTQFFRDQKQLLPLVSEDFDNRHPHAEDILEGLCSLLPIQKGIFVHDLLEKSNLPNKVYQLLMNKSITATILLSPPYIPSSQIRFIRRLSGHPKNFVRLLKLSQDVWFVHDHPFNFFFWSKRLETFSMNERDVHWSEYLRELREDFIPDLIEEFNDLQTLSQVTEEQQHKIELFAAFLVWTLTSTNVALKEKTSKALFAYGVRFFPSLATKFKESLSINDPTVVEGMQMILYNVILHNTKIARQEHRKNLIDIVQFLLTHVLRRSGKHATNHLLIRNYAFSTIKLLYRKFEEVRELISVEGLQKTFKDFGTIEWQEAEDRNAGQYSDGNTLIDYYFEKEKMPYIITGKGSQYDRTPEYLSAQAKLRWRAYELGYRLELFGDIDKGIARYRHFGDDFRKTERYADKYIEIAFLEYCGYLAALGKLKSYEDVGYLRTFELKIDPTTAEVSDHVHRDRLVTKTYIDSTVSLSEWGTDKSIPDVTEYLVRYEFTTERTPFCLLYGLVHQHSTSAERQIFFQINTVFVKNKDLHQTTRSAFTAPDAKLDRSPDNIPHTSHVHASEIPDGDIIPYNEFTEWYYSAGMELVERTYQKVMLVKDGMPLGESEADDVWDQVLNKLHYIPTSRENLAGFTRPQVRFSASIEGELSLEETFHQMGIRLGEISFRKKEQREIEKKLSVFTPVRQIKGGIYLSKNMIDSLKLESAVGQTDLFDEAGQLASLYHQHEESYVDQEAFTYVRKDLLDRYLLDKDLTMFIIISGERDYYPPDGDWTKRTEKLQNRKWAHFYTTVEYALPKKADS